VRTSSRAPLLPVTVPSPRWVRVGDCGRSAPNGVRADPGQGRRPTTDRGRIYDLKAEGVVRT
jgi:hypothetical protein